MTTTQLPASATNSYDYIIVGGGTAGCVVASRLSDYLPDKKVLLLEAGPSDFNDDRVLKLKEWLSLLGGDLDYDYGTTEQHMGNSYIRHSRAKVLGGCSSHNTVIAFRPFEYDLKVWEKMGAQGWNFKTFTRIIDNLRNTIQPVHARHRNQFCKDWVNSCSTSLDIPIIHDFNKEIRNIGSLKQGVGFFSVSYNPDDGRRSSSSVAYIHPILRGDEKRSNLTIVTNVWVNKVNLAGDDAVTGVDVTLQRGERLTLKHKSETILCAGAIDTPRLMLLSGLGPRKQLEDLGIQVHKDIPGVGENLLDHAESIIVWELNKAIPPETTMDSDAGIFLRRQLPNSALDGEDGDIADIMMHCYQIPFCINTARLGYDIPIHAFCMTPNIPRPRSRGRLYLTSADPTEKPALDFRYFTDPGGYDAATLVYGIRAARRVAEEQPFKGWLKREVAPGLKLQTDEELNEYARRVAHTVFHPAGTMRMGDVVSDAMAVVDPQLKVRGVNGLRIADASVFPALPTINPMLTVLAVGERAAELVATEGGWRGDWNSCS